MKNLFNNLTEEEKKSILEQHYNNKENISEQLRGLGGQIGAKVQQAAKAVGTVGQRVGAAVSGKQALGKSAELEGKLVYAKQVTETLYNNLLATAQNLEKNKATNVPADYKDEADSFNAQMTALITSINNFAKSDLGAKRTSLQITYTNTGGTQTQTTGATQTKGTQTAPVQAAKAPTAPPGGTIA